MKALLSLLLVISVALNVGFLTGCVALHDAVYGNPCRVSYSPVSRPSGDNGKADLVSIAQLLGIRTTGKSASDLASDIRYALDRNADVPVPLSEENYKKLQTRLLPAERPVLEGYQRFISQLQGQRVIVYKPEE